MSDVRVRFLGTGNPFGTGGRFQACILVDGPDGRVLLDCGATSPLAMARAGVSPDSIDAVLLTHLHGDHFGGIPFLIVEAQATARDDAAGPRCRPLRIAGPAVTEERVRVATEAFGYGASYRRARETGLLEYLTLEHGRPTAVGPVSVTAFAVPHTPEATALRVSYAGKTIAYSGDTGWTDALLDVAADADLFICQAWSFDADDATLLSHRTLMEQRNRLTCRRLVLTHVGPEMQRHLAEATAEVAEDGMIVEL